MRKCILCEMELEDDEKFVCTPCLQCEPQAFAQLLILDRDTEGEKNEEKNETNQVQQVLRFTDKGD